MTTTATGWAFQYMGREHAVTRNGAGCLELYEILGRETPHYIGRVDSIEIGRPGLVAAARAAYAASRS
jgi:hypothetical protein